MVFYFLISIVFIAELIIGLTLLVYLFKADKMVLKYNELVEETRPSIKEVMILVRKISKQLVELAPMITTKIKSLLIDILMGQLKSMLGALTFYLVKKEVEKHA